MAYVLTATDAPWIAEEVRGALERADTTVRVVAAGQHVRPAVEDEQPDLVVLDMQIGNMGGMAACLDLRLESGAGRLERIPVLMLLDRIADIYLAQRADADGWLIKPLDAYRLRSAASALMAAGRYFEQPDGTVATTAVAPGGAGDEGDAADDDEADGAGETTGADAVPVEAGAPLAPGPAPGPGIDRTAEAHDRP